MNDGSPNLNALRPDLRRFAMLMEKKLRENDHKSSWKDCSLDYLVRRLRQEYEELRRALSDCPPNQKSDDDPDRAASLYDARLRVAREAADVANFAMMIADVYGEIEEVEFKYPPKPWEVSP